jgi:hypothetical protein
MGEKSRWSERSGGEIRGGTKSPEEIREEIERTRAGLTGTVQEIKERLSASHLKSEGMEMLRDATVGRVRSGMAKRAGSMLNESPLARKVAYNALTAVFFGASFGRLIFSPGKSDGRQRMEGATGSVTEGLRCGVSTPE